MKQIVILGKATQLTLGPPGGRIEMKANGPRPLWLIF